MLQVRTGEVQLLKLAGAQELPEEGPPSALGCHIWGDRICSLSSGLWSGLGPFYPFSAPIPSLEWERLLCAFVYWEYITFYFPSETGLLCIPSCPGTHSMDQTGLELKDPCLCWD